MENKQSDKTFVSWRDSATKPKPNLKQAINRINTYSSAIVLGTGIILLIVFHMGGGAFRQEWLGIPKAFWLIVHQITAVMFSVGFILHLRIHWNYLKKIARRWRVNLPVKTKKKSKIQFLFLVITLVVLWAGFFPWLSIPEASLKNASFHWWIDIHNKVGVALLIGMIIHIRKRWNRIFIPKKRDR